MKKLEWEDKEKIKKSKDYIMTSEKPDKWKGLKEVKQCCQQMIIRISRGNKS